MVILVFEALTKLPSYSKLTLKGGTSLYKDGCINRLSEDLDIMYEIRDVMKGAVGNDFGYPQSPSMADKWRKKSRDFLNTWITDSVVPTITEQGEKYGIELNVSFADKETLFVYYPALVGYTDYIQPSVKLEFGANDTGLPLKQIKFTTESAKHIKDITFPECSGNIMLPQRTLLEKITALHTFCLTPQKARERQSRHWYDVAMLSRDESMISSIMDINMMRHVLYYQSMYYRQKDEDGRKIEQHKLLSGMNIIPTGTLLESVRDDYEMMHRYKFIYCNAPSFDEILDRCRKVESELAKVYNPDIFPELENIKISSLLPFTEDKASVDSKMVTFVLESPLRYREIEDTLKNEYLTRVFLNECITNVMGHINPLDEKGTIPAHLQHLLQEKQYQGEWRLISGPCGDEYTWDAS